MLIALLNAHHAIEGEMGDCMRVAGAEGNTRAGPVSRSVVRGPIECWLAGCRKHASLDQLFSRAHLHRTQSLRYLTRASSCLLSHQRSLSLNGTSGLVAGKGASAKYVRLPSFLFLSRAFSSLHPPPGSTVRSFLIYAHHALRSLPQDAQSRCRSRQRSSPSRPHHNHRSGRGKQSEAHKQPSARLRHLLTFSLALIRLSSPKTSS